MEKRIRKKISWNPAAKLWRKKFQAEISYRIYENGPTVEFTLMYLYVESFFSNLKLLILYTNEKYVAINLYYYYYYNYGHWGWEREQISTAFPQAITKYTV
jgi:hypothetical protein